MPSKVNHKNRADDFKDFCHYVNDVIKPKVTIVGGDMTDAVARNHIGSGQIKEEWKSYRSAWEACGATPDTWLDVRGNHDVSDVDSDTSENSFFNHFAVQARL